MRLDCEGQGLTGLLQKVVGGANALELKAAAPVSDQRNRQQLAVLAGIGVVTDNQTQTQTETRRANVSGWLRRSDEPGKQQQTDQKPYGQSS